ncbi:phosphatase PAP2 family protein [Mesorhizobium sp. WSM4904]|uniref:phosphatase PAP2 family protein n=1 Tax=Mesorhizobium sp. WSM4904 TaxID=3038545 RepID=UPI0024188DEB|nr:phosphatase PAP2 family protein [Mesorhizobium sp. WSM4904]WFP62778.1 phosphatase PAP2 family protein [Mesorhizobium sp. WSM4904]
MPTTEAILHGGSVAAWRANNSFYIAIATYILLAVIAAEHWGIPIDVKLYNQGFWVFGCAVAVVLFSIISIRVMLSRPERIFPEIKAKLAKYQLGERIIRGVPVLIVFPIFFSIFTSMKEGINRIVPFYFDQKLVEIDRFINFGTDAWRVFHPVLGIGAATFTINFFYNLWFVFMFVVLFCVIFSVGNDRLRSRYLVAFVLTWAILGNVAATIFASVGPAFVMPFFGDGTFAPLMDYLKATNNVYPVWALYAQNMLLTNAASDGPRMGSGISAFPSMHVAIAMLNAVFLWRFGGILRWIGVAFLIMTQLGAVHLAWHYAIDGYASMLATPIIWMLAGWLSTSTKRG